MKSKSENRELRLGTAVCIALLLSFVVVISSAQPARAESVGSWTETNPWKNSYSSSGITGESCAVSSGYVYCVGGFLVGGPRTEVYYAQILEIGVNFWVLTTAYPTGFNEGSCAISSGYIYCVGGTADESFPYTPANGVYSATVSGSGVGAWQTSVFPTVIDGESCATSTGYIYCVGGDSVSPQFTDIVAYATVSAGSVGAWTISANHYPTDITGASCATSSGYIYCVGGLVDGATFASAVYYAAVSASGVAAWTSTSSYPEPIYQQSCQIYQGYIYCIGGQTTGSFISNLVYYAQISGTETTSSSSSTNPAPVPVCPSTFGGSLMPPGATFTDMYGNTWVAPNGNDGSGGIWSSYFFPGPESTIPPPLLQGWGGVYGMYNGQNGWIITFFC